MPTIDGQYTAGFTRTTLVAGAGRRVRYPLQTINALVAMPAPAFRPNAMRQEQSKAPSSCNSPRQIRRPAELKEAAMSENKGHGIGNVLDRGAEMIGSAVGLASASTLGATGGTAFLTNSAISNSYAIEASEIAIMRSLSPVVRALAERLRRDHTSTLAALKREAKRQDSTVSYDLDQRHQGLVAILEKAKPEDFDKAFLHQMTAAQTEGLTLHAGYVKHGDNVQLRHLAQTAVPVIEDHLRAIKDAVKRETTTEPFEGLKSSS